MSASPYDVKDEPKKYWNNILIWMLAEVNKIIYFRKSKILQTLEPMQGIIDFLPQKSKNQLKEVNDEINRYLGNANLVKNRKQIKEIYRKISTYLLNTHLKEVAWARPRHGKATLGLPEDDRKKD